MTRRRLRRLALGRGRSSWSRWPRRRCRRLHRVGASSDVGPGLGVTASVRFPDRRARAALAVIGTSLAFAALVSTVAHRHRSLQRAPDDDRDPRRRRGRGRAAVAARRGPLATVECRSPAGRPVARRAVLDPDTTSRPCSCGSAATRTTTGASSARPVARTGRRPGRRDRRDRFTPARGVALRRPARSSGRRRTRARRRAARPAPPDRRAARTRRARRPERRRGRGVPRRARRRAPPTGSFSPTSTRRSRAASRASAGWTSSASSTSWPTPRTVFPDAAAVGQRRSPGGCTFPSW